MAKAEYISAVERTLREDVLPVTSDEVARDSLASCINILRALRGGMDLSDAVPPRDATAVAALPVEVRSFFEGERPSGQVPDGLADDLAARRGTIAALEAGREWILKNNGATDRPDAVNALLAWERAQRKPALAMLAGNAAVAVSNVSRVADLSQEPLQAYFAARYGPGARITAFRRLMGGRSRQTALFSQSGVPDLPTDLVVQRDPPVYTGVPGVEVQAPVMAAAHAAGMRAPKPWFVENSREPLGAPFMVVDRLPGRPIIDATTEYFLPPPLGLEHVARSLAGQMAILHGIAVAPLERILNHSFDPARGTWVDEIARLSARLREISSGPSIAVTVGIHWLERHAHLIAPRWAVIHTDMLLHNLLMEGDEVTGVLDWEIAHIGHPGEDLGYVRPVIQQIMPWSQFLDAYSRAGGVPLTGIESDFFGIYAAIRLLTLVQHPRLLFEQGATNDLRLAETAASFIPQQIDRIDRIVASVLQGQAAQVTA